MIYSRNRPGLERLVEYCSRPALSISRLICAAATKTVIYRAERRDGTPELMTMDELKFLRRWGLLMPPSHKNLVHYYGALAPRSPLRRALTAKAEKEAKKVLLRKGLKSSKTRPAPGPPAWRGSSRSSS